jgi:methionine sulfoxide reductase catalytic subunit
MGFVIRAGIQILAVYPRFASVGFWVLNGLVYVIGLLASGGWPRLIPQSWSVIPDAWQTFLGYLTLQSPPASAFDPFAALQQLAYGAVVFLLAPFLILTGAAQSPAIDARFPRYVGFFGGRQGARSLHFCWRGR